MTQNLLVYSRPYGSTRDFEVKRLFAVQDSLPAFTFQDPSRGSYIAFEPKVQPVSEVLDNDYSDYCVEVRGLWRCIGDVMGGPFVSRSYLSADHKNIITSVAFIYGPGHDKRNVLVCWRRPLARSGLNRPNQPLLTASPTKNRISS